MSNIVIYRIIRMCTRVFTPRCYLSIITLIFSLLGFSVIPYGPGLAISDFDLKILYMLAVFFLSANSK